MKINLKFLSTSWKFKAAVEISPDNKLCIRRGIQESGHSPRQIIWSYKFAGKSKIQEKTGAHINY